MRILEWLAAIALVACGPGRTTFARYPGSPATFDRATSDPKAVAIADKVIAAVGGSEKWKTAKQLRWKQAITHDGKEITAGEQAWDRWNGRHYARAKRGEEGDVVVMRPLYENGGSVFLDNGERMRKLEGGTVEALATAQERWEFDTGILFLPYLLEEPGTRLAYEGESLGEDGKPRDMITVSFDPKDKRRVTYHVAVDRETNLIDRIEIQKAGKGANERLGYSAKDWNGAGIKFPGTLQNLGLKGEVITFKEVTISEVDDNLFVPPL